LSNIESEKTKSQKMVLVYHERRRHNIKSEITIPEMREKYI
jgi:hypothetical protein